MAESQKFKIWHRLECAKRLGQVLHDEDSNRLSAGFGETKIRTYHFPDQRVVDHRSNKQYNLKQTLDGRLEPIIRDFLEPK